MALDGYVRTSSCSSIPRETANGRRLAVRSRSIRVAAAVTCGTAADVVKNTNENLTFLARQVTPSRHGGSVASLLVMDNPISATAPVRPWSQQWQEAAPSQ